MLALFGGTFNPPHLGHIQSVINAARECKISEVGLLPCKLSPLKTETCVSDEHRLAMLKLAIESVQNEDVNLYIEDIELSLPAPSYTINTLKELHSRQRKNEALNFFLGEDSLYTLHKWREWDSLLNLCNIVVMPRKEHHLAANNTVRSWMKEHMTQNIDDLHRANGSIYLCNSPFITVSSTQLRTLLNKDPALASPWLPELVLHYIEQHALYKQ